MENMTPGLQFILESKLKLLKYIVRFVRDEHAAEDIFQDIIVIYLKLDEARRVKADDHLIKWLLLVARRESLDSIERTKKLFYDDFTTTGFEENKNIKSLIHDDNPFYELDRKEQFKLLRKSINKLNKNQQEVINFRYFKHLNYREISQTTGLSETNVGFLLNRAADNLKSSMIKVNRLTNKAMKVKSK